MLSIPALATERLLLSQKGISQSWSHHLRAEGFLSWFHSAFIQYLFIIHCQELRSVRKTDRVPALMEPTLLPGER